MSDLEIGVLGAGVMGSGIAQSLAQAGYQVVCSDPDEGALERARRNTQAGRYGLERAVARGKLDPAEAEDAAARLRCTSAATASSSSGSTLGLSLSSLFLLEERW